MFLFRKVLCKCSIIVVIDVVVMGLWYFVVVCWQSRCHSVFLCDIFCDMCIGSNKAAPIFVISGGKDSGKSTLCRYLVNKALNRS